jgi:hypothetical protein
MSAVATADVELRAKSKLMECPIVALRQLDVEQSEGLLLISGQVTSFYYKQLAQELVRSTADGMRVVNNVVVQADETIGRSKFTSRH